MSDLNLGEVFDETIIHIIYQHLYDNYEKFIWKQNDYDYYTTIIVNSREIEIQVDKDFPRCISFVEKNYMRHLQFEDKNNLADKLQKLMQRIIDPQDILNALKSYN